VSKIRYRKSFNSASNDCLTANVVYLITCNTCQYQYVGETNRTAHIRWTEHGRDTKKHRDTLLDSHFNMPSHLFEEATLEIIDMITGDPASKSVEQKRISRETFWIINLKTLHPLGINGRLGRPISN
jgi:hypothetical protein